MSARRKFAASLLERWTFVHDPSVYSANNLGSNPAQAKSRAEEEVRNYSQVNLDSSLAR